MNSVTTILPMVFLLSSQGRSLRPLLPQRRTEGGEIDAAGDLRTRAATETQERPDAPGPRARMGAAAQLCCRPRRRLHVDVRRGADRRDEAAGLQAWPDAGLPAPRQRRPHVYLCRERALRGGQPAMAVQPDPRRGAGAAL